MLMAESFVRGILVVARRKAFLQLILGLGEIS